jgi:hypothetical protein
MKKYLTTLTLAIVLMVHKAHATVTLPDLGVDVPSHITAALSTLSVIIIAALGAWFAFKALRAGLRYVGKALGGR